MAGKYEAPVSITIPIPSERPRMYGVHSNYHQDAARIYPRLNAHESQILEQACAILELKPASFARDVIVNAAEKVVAHYHDHIKMKETYDAHRKHSGGG